MSFLKNRAVIGVICIVLSLIICFAVTPLFNKAISDKTEIVRVVKEIRTGEEITADMVKTVEVGAYNLPEDVVRSTETAVGKFASADMVPGDYIIASKIADRGKTGNFRIRQILCKRPFREAAEWGYCLCDCAGL